MELKDNLKEIDITNIEDISGTSFSYINNLQYEKLKLFIKKYGQIKNIVVVQGKKNKYKIVDGYQVYTCMKDLGYEKILVSILDKEYDPKIFSILLNIKFGDDLVKLSKMIKVLLEEYSSQELSEILPFEKTEIEKYPLLLDFDFKKYNVNEHNKLYYESNNKYF